MPLVTTTEMFKKAYEGGYAIGAFKDRKRLLHFSLFLFWNE